MANFNWVDIILFIGLAQGLFLSINFQLIQNRNKKANQLLSLILLLTTIMLVARIIYVNYYEPWMLRWSLFPDTLIFLIPLLVFKYLKRLLLNESVNSSFIFYYTLFCVYLLMAIYFAVQPYDVFVDFANSGGLKLSFYWIEAVAIIYNILFLVFCFSTIIKTEKLEKQNLSFHQTTLKYLKAFLSTYLFIVIAWAGVFIYYLSYQKYLDYINYDSIWIAITVDIFLISYYSLKQPELLRMVEVKKEKVIEKNISKKKRIDDAKIKELSKELDRLMQEENLFLDNELTLKKLAQQMNASANDISWLLNEVYKKSFYDFVNNYRLEKFKELVANEEYKTKTILALAIEVGFNSKSSFNNFFKLQMKQTPSAYINTHKSLITV